MRPCFTVGVKARLSFFPLMRCPRLCTFGRRRWSIDQTTGNRLQFSTVAKIDQAVTEIGHVDLESLQVESGRLPPLYQDYGARLRGGTVRQND
ncbi:hypothetical protein K239x_50430 [Planctomycetes bacterium K23_9]|uniref:Uncharacterized protein n=1 Tax=Stieleria marina TaxID=1930275 RepID=A0A517P0X9_9BACT|nr:hypothetical protein K239x_50430 [Planctomycetes bacterium K23_9]